MLVDSQLAVQKIKDCIWKTQSARYASEVENLIKSLFFFNIFGGDLYF